jgi:aminoglycoside phosphotransferase (APT) family kinase protein
MVSHNLRQQETGSCAASGGCDAEWGEIAMGIISCSFAIVPQSREEHLMPETNLEPLQVAFELETVRRLAGLADTDAIELNEAGWTSRVYLVDGGRYVVKFPRSERVKLEYRKEVAFLQAIAEIEFEVLLPRLCWVEDNFAYVGYEGIVGQSLEALLESADERFKKSIGRQLGGFLKQLHAVKNGAAIVRTLDEEIDEYQRKYALARTYCATILAEKELFALDRHVQIELPDAMRRLGRAEVLSHGDLGFWNMLVDADGVLGIIDFGDCGLWDHSRDFAVFTEQVILNEALRIYGDTDLLRQKIALRQASLPLLELHYYLGKADERAIARTMAGIRALLQ